MCDLGKVDALVVRASVPVHEGTLLLPLLQTAAYTCECRSERHADGEGGYGAASDNVHLSCTVMETNFAAPVPVLVRVPFLASGNYLMAHVDQATVR